MLGWRGFVWVVVGASFGLLAAMYLFIILMNPYGNLPHLVFSKHAITDINQRFQYPALVRSGEFDSIVIGTSDSRLLKPAALNKIFGGHFANLAMNAGHAWEQYQIAKLFIRKTPHARTLLVAIDAMWCRRDALVERTTFRGFPKWMYDDNPWNDFLYMLNGKSLEISVRRLGVALGLNRARFEAGYEGGRSGVKRVRTRSKLSCPLMCQRQRSAPPGNFPRSRGLTRY
jgi:hypothetical protein